MASGKDSKFKLGVIKVVNKIPKSKVVSYGQVALYLGVPRAARQVGWTLNKIEESIKIPWWRVVNNAGRITIKSYNYSPLDQKLLLENEGVEIADDFSFDIEKYRYLPDRDILKEFELDEDYINMVLFKFDKYFT